MVFANDNKIMAKVF